MLRSLQQSHDSDTEQVGVRLIHRRIRDFRHWKHLAGKALKSFKVYIEKRHLPSTYKETKISLSVPIFTALKVSLHIFFILCAWMPALNLMQRPGALWPRVTGGWALIASPAELGKVSLKNYWGTFKKKSVFSPLKCQNVKWSYKGHCTVQLTTYLKKWQY